MSLIDFSDQLGFTEYCSTLEKIAIHGADAFYEGEIGMIFDYKRKPC